MGSSTSTNSCRQTGRPALQRNYLFDFYFFNYFKVEVISLTGRVNRQLGLIVSELECVCSKVVSASGCGVYFSRRWTGVMSSLLSVCYLEKFFFARYVGL